MKTLFIGTLEAQYKLCRNELALQLLPQVNEIIQLGNLTSCSKASKDKKELGRNEITLTFWDKIALPKTRLMGAHEMMALNYPDEWTNAVSNAFLRNGWLSETPTLLVAAVSKSRLVTHAGLTYGQWVELGRPPTAQEAADALNQRYARTLDQGRSVRLGDRPNLAANPIWADPVLELYPSWVLAPEACPFDQIHGHESLNTSRGRAAAAHKSHPLFYMEAVSYRKFGSMANIGGAEFRAIDMDLPSKLLPSVPGDKAFYVEAS